MQLFRIIHHHPRSDVQTPETLLLKNPCDNIGALLACLHSEAEIQLKSKIIDHIFSCENCYSSFKDFISLSGSINTFSKDFSRQLNIHNKCRNLQPNSLLWIKNIKLPYIPFTLAILTIAIILAYIGNLPREAAPDSIRWRGMSFANYFKINPFPYSAIPRHSLRFSISNESRPYEWKVIIFDSELGFFWESDKSAELFIIPEIVTLNSFKKGPTYYWKYVAIDRSGNSQESELLPFTIVD